jgi:hypothetical protein
LYSSIRSGLMPITMPMRFITVPPIVCLSRCSLSFAADRRHAASVLTAQSLSYVIPA